MPCAQTNPDYDNIASSLAEIDTLQDPEDALWAMRTGQNYTKNHSHGGIDFGTLPRVGCTPPNPL